MLASEAGKGIEPSSAEVRTPLPEPLGDPANDEVMGRALLPGGPPHRYELFLHRFIPYLFLVGSHVVKHGG